MLFLTGWICSEDKSRFPSNPFSIAKRILHWFIWHLICDDAAIAQETSGEGIVWLGRKRRRYVQTRGTDRSSMVVQRKGPRVCVGAKLEVPDANAVAQETAGVAQNLQVPHPLHVPLQ